MRLDPRETPLTIRSKERRACGSRAFEPQQCPQLAGRDAEPLARPLLHASMPAREIGATARNRSEEWARLRPEPLLERDCPAQARVELEGVGGSEALDQRAHGCRLLRERGDRIGR